MRISKMAAVGFLLCLVCLFFTNELWDRAGLAILQVLGVYAFPAGVIVALVGIFKKDP